MTKGVQTGNGSIIIESDFECPEGCSSCTSSDHCTECYKNYLSNGLCETKCPIGTIAIGHECVPCDSSCSECQITVDHCTKCPEGYFVQDNKCVNSCTEGFVETDKKCEKCEFPCRTCKSQVDHCTSCKEDYILLDNKCILECPNKMIRVGSSCENCNPFCESCYSSVDHCTSCIEGFYLLDHKCVPSCPNGKVGHNGQCVDCNSPCETCSSIDVCTTCIDGYLSSDGKCVAVCPQSTTKIDIICVKCKIGCKTCSDSSDNCQKCSDNYYLYENQCYSECNELNSKDDGKYFGKNENQKVCTECSVSNCISCDDDYSSCKKCSESFILVSGECVPKTADELSSESDNEIESSNTEVTTEEHESESSEIMPTIDPSTISCLASLEKENITLYDRCIFSGFDINKVFVYLKRSLFSDFINESDGGAVYIQECSINFAHSNFTNCISSNGCGGAIYINNIIEKKNDIFFTDLAFTKCKATYAGSCFIFSKSLISNVSLISCIFISNEATGRGLDKNSPFYGGSAVFLGARSGIVFDCKFIDNKGSKGAIKIYNDFKDDSNNLKIVNFLEINRKSIVVSNCDFTTNVDSESSIYYINGKEGSEIEIKYCNFYGKLSKISEHINGKEIIPNIHKILIKECKLNHDYIDQKFSGSFMLASVFVSVMIIILMITFIVNHSKEFLVSNELEKSDHNKNDYE